MSPRLLLCFFLIAGTGGAQAEELRILTYNIHHGRGADGIVDLERIARVIRSARPDLVALNEVDKGVRRSGEVDQPAELGRLCEMQAVFEKNIDYDGGQYGNAILSTHEVLKHKNIALPSHYEGEQRGLLVAQIKLPSSVEVVFAATHFDYRPDDAERVASVATMLEIAKKKYSRESLIVAGDLNATPESRVLRQLAAVFGVSDSMPTYPAKEPIKQIDYILWTPTARWRVLSTEVLEEPVASDHRPALVVLESPK